MKNLLNIIYNSLKKKNFIVIINKVILRLSINKQKEAHKWAKEKCENFDDFAKNINKDIFEESLVYANYLDNYSKKKR